VRPEAGTAAARAAGTATARWAVVRMAVEDRVCLRSTDST